MRSIHYLFVLVVALLGCRDERSDEGDSYFRKGQYEKAIESYTEYINLYPDNVKSIYNRGRAYEELGQYGKAIKDFKEVIRRDPQNTRALLSLTKDFYIRKKDYENVIFYTDKVLAYDEKNAEAFTFQGRAHQQLGDINDALQDYNSAVSVNKNYIDAYIARGSLRLATGSKRRACSDFQTAEALGSNRAGELRGKYCK